MAPAAPSMPPGNTPPPTGEDDKLPAGEGGRGPEERDRDAPESWEAEEEEEEEAEWGRGWLAG